MTVNGRLVFDIVESDRVFVAQKLALVDETNYLVVRQFLIEICPLNYKKWF